MSNPTASIPIEILAKIFGVVPTTDRRDQRSDPPYAVHLPPANHIVCRHSHHSIDIQRRVQQGTESATRLPSVARCTYGAQRCLAYAASGPQDPGHCQHQQLLLVLLANSVHQGG